MNTRPKILYVDDEEMNLQVFYLYFKKSYEVVTAGNGLEGLSKLEDDPDITAVISDMRMPVMTGVEFIRKAKDQFPDKKYFILTGYTINEDIQKAFDSGLIQKYFSKPINYNEINTAILGNSNNHNHN